MSKAVQEGGQGQQFIAASLSEPRTNVTSLHTCMRMLVWTDHLLQIHSSTNNGILALSVNSKHAQFVFQRRTYLWHARLPLQKLETAMGTTKTARVLSSLHAICSPMTSWGLCILEAKRLKNSSGIIGRIYWNICNYYVHSIGTSLIFHI